ncbi:amidase domain-containing protein [Streptomyces sp. SP18CS02]|uniref:amidase domain-containing protein n=1 Tax=Streptomyces sp. SP18CS02 TaxID=3002531 RepID=UPI002E76F90A|nr:amidase domain-containing protein [Streptomyces sp. SP18CS02]MEE1751934.1 amidase domain-containing protein [Streptomyces sp. SP18CS02]
MKRSTFRVAVGGVLAIAATTVVLPTTAGASWYMPAAPPAAGAVDRDTGESFSRAAEAVLTERTAALLESGPTRRSARLPDRGVRLSSAVARSEGDAWSWLSDRKKRLHGLGEVYTKADTEVALNDTKVADGKATVRVTETTTLTYGNVRGDEARTTGFQAHHEIAFARAADGAWEMTRIRATDAGLAPVNAPLRTPRARTTADDGLPVATAAATSRPGRQPAAKPLDNANGYDYTAMAAYAEKYWSKYNPAYPSYDGAGAGGDCTNFVSQALKAGGWKHAPGSWDDYRKWWSDPQLGNTLSWVGVNEWSWFALSSKRTANLSNVWELGVGDVLQVDFDRDGSKDHTMIVSYRDRRGTPYLTYHSNNTYRKSLSSLLASYPNAKYYAYRT